MRAFNRFKRQRRQDVRRTREPLGPRFLADFTSSRSTSSWRRWLSPEPSQRVDTPRSILSIAGRARRGPDLIVTPVPRPKARPTPRSVPFKVPASPEMYVKSGVCVRRKQRREVIFATGRAGGGARRRPRYTLSSEVSC